MNHVHTLYTVHVHVKVKCIYAIQNVGLSIRVIIMTVE